MPHPLAHQMRQPNCHCEHGITANCGEILVLFQLPGWKFCCFFELFASTPALMDAQFYVLPNRAGTDAGCRGSRHLPEVKAEGSCLELHWIHLDYPL